MNQWYLADKTDGRAIGPISASQMKRLAAAKHLQPTDRVMLGSGTEWVPAASIKGLFPPAALMPGPRRPLVRGYWYTFGVGTAFGLILGIFIGALTTHLTTGAHGVPTAAMAEVPPQTHREVAPIVDSGSQVTKPVEKDEKPPTPAPLQNGNPPIPAPPPVAKDPAVKLPSDQVAFIKKIELFAQRYGEAPNELAKAASFDKRDAALRKAFPNRALRNWVGVLKSLTVANSNHDVQLWVQLAGTRAIGVRTMEVGTGDPQHFETLVKNGTVLHQQVAQLREGDRVVFSGDFVPGRDRHFSDVSRETTFDFHGRLVHTYSTARSMARPVFLFRFGRIAKD
jgi:hypothetical protein